MHSDFRLGPWLVRPALNTLSQNGSGTRLEPKVMEVLVCLAACAGELVSKDTILKAVWPETFVSDDVLTRSISELRRALEDDPRSPRFIETIPKRGYRLVAAVTPVHENLSAPGSSRAATETSQFRKRKTWFAIASLLPLCGILVGFNVGGMRTRIFGSHPPIQSLAVLPLQSLSTDPAQEYFAEGMTDALITDLAQIEALKVVSRTTIMRYGRPNKPLPQIARELNVDGIVEGTVQRSGDRVRVTAQLIYGPADQHLWANSFERDVKDILDLQGTVASEIAGQIRVKITPEEQAKLDSLRPVNPKALDAYLEARFHMDQASRLEFYKGKREALKEHLRKAESYLDSAIREDPSYMPAYGAYWNLLDVGDVPRLEFLPNVKSVLTKGLELDEANVPAHLALARLLMQYDYDWTGADREYKRAVELDPKSAEAHYQYSEYLDNVGRSTEGSKELELAQSLDPAHDYRWTCCDEAHVIRTGMSMDEEANAIDEKAPDDPFLQGLLAKDYAVEGRYKESVERYERCLTVYGWPDFVNVLKRANAKGGPKFALEEWMRAAEEYDQKRGDMPVVPMAFTYSSIGNKDRAFQWLDKAVVQRNWMIIYLKRDNVWDPLRSDPRFTALLRRVGLPE